MGRIAPQVASWQRRLRNLPGPFQSASLGGIPILTGQFSDLRLYVEFAWGANLANNSSTWTWYDVTTDVQVDGNRKITIQTGRQDERSVAGPTACTFTLDNRQNKYSASALGQNWPNVKRGVPVRVRAVLNGSSTTLFQGNASALVPSFDSTGRYAIVGVTANGILRRLSQGNAPVQSTMRTYTPGVSNLIAYWPMEDGTDATSFASGLTGGSTMGFAGSVQLHSSTTLVGSDALPVFNGYGWAPGPVYTPTGAVQVRALTVWPAAGSALPDGTPLFRVFTSGTIAYWDLVYHTGGGLSAVGYLAYDGSKVFDTGTVVFNVDGLGMQVGLSMSQSGSDVAVQMSTMKINASTGNYWNATATGQTVVGCNALGILPNNTTSSVIIGHVTIQSAATDIFENAQAVSAYDSEFSYARLQRILPLAGAESRGMFGDGSTNPSRMGPQRIDTVLNLIREVEKTDVAVVLDGHDASLTSWSHIAIENLPTAITLDATAGHLVPPFEITDDDQLLRNQWSVSQRNGSSVVAQDTTGPYGSNNVGLYPDSETVNVFMNTSGSLAGAFGIKALNDRAGWLLHEGTVEGYRYPKLELAFHHSPTLLPSWMGIQKTGLGRVEVVNLTSVYPQLPPGNASLLAVGMMYEIDQFTWTTVANCVPYDVWKVIVAAQTSGDTGEFIVHLDTSGSAVTSAAMAGASTISVSTNTGPIWTTDSDDFPFTVSIGGLPVTVTSISGSSSPQTFTVDPATVTKELAAGLAVNVWKPPVLAIGGTA